MESITIKVEKRFAQEIEKAMHPYYSTKTEFIREAIREKLKRLHDDSLMRDLRKKLGAAKTKTPLHRDREIREEVGRKMLAEFEEELAKEKLN
ncbi:hypothetical protein COV93_04965 [Candidatus Woesearchaeota archaeon CG11_big_fil_rev_8_21_14_0_20_43_8]|nr:MAG: hypothetical protein COV93_04965 [Candidatus Woesearchaeota archaeon CG11_big_fil_rev_8_21_14_0_20_43_8]PIO05608.1 MAG: hypothetical protein COT47_04060 [Candidatus Woesearchaeota archaeon CG08_land_8_20_14_0_20_43_7]